jgi:hypothetical protein
MSTMPQGFLHRLFLRPSLWVSMLPGMALVMMDYGCSGLTPMIWKKVCDIGLLNHNSSVWYGFAFFALDAVLYARFRIVEIKEIWLKTHRIAWIPEIALLVTGECFVFFSVAFAAFFTMRGI